MVLEMLWVSSRKKIVSRERKTEKLGSLDDRNVQKFDGYVEAKMCRSLMGTFSDLSC
jgi:hypothetical protein